MVADCALMVVEAAEAKLPSFVFTPCRIPPRTWHATCFLDGVSTLSAVRPRPESGRNIVCSP